MFEPTPMTNLDASPIAHHPIAFSESGLFLTRFPLFPEKHNRDEPSLFQHKTSPSFSTSCVITSRNWGDKRPARSRGIIDKRNCSYALRGTPPRQMEPGERNCITVALRHKESDVKWLRNRLSVVISNKF